LYNQSLATSGTLQEIVVLSLVKRCIIYWIFLVNRTQKMMLYQLVLFAEKELLLKHTQKYFISTDYESAIKILGEKNISTVYYKKQWASY